MLTAWFTGFVMGVAGSIPVAGPTTMLVLSFGLRGKIRTATLVAVGSALPEGAWAALAMWGFGALLRSYGWVESVSQIFAILILFAVGAFLIVRASAAADDSGAEASPGREVVGTARTILLGASLTGLNPTLVLNWGAAVTLAVSFGAVAPTPEMAAPFGFGVLCGIVAWFVAVLRLLERHHRRISIRARANLLRAMGAVLMILGIVALARVLIAGE